MKSYLLDLVQMRKCQREAFASQIVFVANLGVLMVSLVSILKLTLIKLIHIKIVTYKVTKIRIKS